MRITREETLKQREKGIAGLAGLDLPIQGELVREGVRPPEDGGGHQPR